MNAPRQDLGTVMLALVATTSVQALVTVGTLTLSVAAPEAAQDIGVTPEAIGIYASLVYLGAMIGSITASGFILRYGAIRVSQVVMAICALGLIIGSVEYWVVVGFSAIICGLGYGPTTPASSHILSRHSPRRFLGLVFSVKQTGVPLGGLLAGLLVPLLLAVSSWQETMWIVAAIILASAAALELSRRRFDLDLRGHRPFRRLGLAAPLKLVFARPELRLLVSGSFLFAAIQQSYIYFLVTFLQVGVGWSNQDAGLALSVLGASAVVGRIFWGAVADATRRGSLVLAILGFGMAASAAVTALTTPHWPGWIVFTTCAVFGATGVAWNGVYLAEISRRVTTDEVGMATGGGLFVTFAGVVFAPPMFSVLTQLTGTFTTGYLVLAGSTASLSALMLISSSRKAE